MTLEQRQALAFVLAHFMSDPRVRPLRSLRDQDDEIQGLRADAARAKGLIQRLAAEARQSGDLVRDPEALALAAMYYGA